MGNQSGILLVEGEFDRAFFEVICKSIGLDTSVKVAPPKSLSGTHNTKEGVFNYSPTLLSQLADGSLTRLGLVVDADSPPTGGFATTLTRVHGIVAPYGYKPLPTLGVAASGQIYKNDDGLADIGLWVMPDNAANGILEDWAKQCLLPAEAALFNLAATTVAALPVPKKFSGLHVSKAEVATWLAWQKQPGHGLYRAAEDGLFDTGSPQYVALIAWLEHVFA